MGTDDCLEIEGISLFGGRSRDDILSNYFNIKPLFVSQAVPEPENLLSIESFYDSLPKTENVRAVFNSMHRASIAPNDARDMLAAGATICATGIDLAVPAIRDLAEEARSELRYLGIVSANAYCSPNGAGFSQHYDPRIVTVVQLSGSKTWEFSKVPFEANPIGVSYNDESRETLLREHNRRVGTESITLVPGDVLVLPAGTVHEARAGGLSLSLNIAFDYIGKGAADLLVNWLLAELLKDPDYREPLFAASPRHLKLIDRMIERTALLISELQRDPSQCLERHPD